MEHNNYHFFSRFVRHLLLLMMFAFFSPGYANYTLKSETKTVAIADKGLWHKITTSKLLILKDTPSIEQLAEEPLPTLLGQRGMVVTQLPLTVADAGHWYVVPTANFVDFGMAYWQDEKGNISSIANFSQSNSSNSIHLAHGQAFRLSFRGPEKGVLWIEMKSAHFPTPGTIKIYSESEFASVQLKSNTLTTLAVSIMCALGIMALVIFFRTRQRVALFCGGYVGLHGVGWALAAGLIQSFWSPESFNSTYGGIYLFPFAIACAAYFAYYLFNLSEGKNGLSRLLERFVQIALILGVTNSFLPFYIAFYITHVLASVWIVVCLYTAFRMLSSEDFRAKYFLVGNSLYSLSLGYYILSHAHVYNLNYPELVVLTALTIDCFCILLCLSEWLRIRQVEHQNILNEVRFDSLTGVGNRHFLNETLVNLEEYYFAVFIDCDSIKLINDRQGHEEGDLFLQYVADLMAFKLGSKGLVFRSGGDEFIWICQAQTEQSLSALKKHVSRVLPLIDANITTRWPQSGISYGIADSLESRSPSNCLSQADSRMYEHKFARKNPLQTELLNTE